MTEENAHEESTQRNSELRRHKIDDYSKCYSCKSTGLVEGRDDFCPNCRFPQAGDDRDIDRFLLRLKRREDEIEAERKKVKRGEYILYGLGVLNLLVGLVVFSQDNDVFALASHIIVAGAFIALGIWSRRKPFEAFIAGLSVYAVLLVLSAIVDVSTLFQGMLWKVLIICGLFYGFKAAKEVKELEKQLAHAKQPKDFTVKDDL